MWTDHAQARCIEFEAGAATQRFVGEHDGYMRLDDPVTHRRQIDFDPQRQMIDVSDVLRCEGEHTARRAWHFAEDCVVEQQGQGLKITSGRTVVIMEPVEPLERVEIHRGGTAEQGGWVSRRFGHKLPGTTVLWHSRVTGSTTLNTRITYTRTRSLGV
jgi:hypothetical protein